MIRLLLVIGCLVVFALALWGMRRGWLNRIERQADLSDPPRPPAEPGDSLLTPMTGVYVGTTLSDSWQDRVAAGGLGLRAAAEVTLYRSGVLIEREATAPVFIPVEQILGADLAAGLAGKVVGAGGLLVIRWRHGDRILDTALRADDKTSYPEWVATLRACAQPTGKGADA